MTRSVNQGRALYPAQNAQQLTRPLLSPIFLHSAANQTSPPPSHKNFAASGHAPLLYIHYSTQSSKNSRCEFSTMHRNRVATGTRQQDLSPFCSPPLPASSTTSSSATVFLSFSLLFAVVAFSLITLAVRLWSGAVSRFFGMFRQQNVAFPTTTGIQKLVTQKRGVKDVTFVKSNRSLITNSRQKETKEIII